MRNSNLSGRKRISYAKWGYLFIAPFFIIYGIFTLYPQLLTIYNSFFENYRSGLRQIGPNFVGFENYVTLFTPDKNFSIDYYQKVHSPGISLIGAHTRARPDHDSYPGYFTERDDIIAVLRLISANRLSFKSLIPEQSYDPKDCQAVYDRVINDRSFPTLAQFNWTNVEL